MSFDLMDEVRARKIAAGISPNKAWVRTEDIDAVLSARANEISALAQEIAVEIQSAADRLSQVLHQLPVAPGTTYRGAHYGENLLARCVPGSVLTEKTFTRTSRDLPSAIADSDSGNVLLEISGRHGRDVGSYPTAGQENGVLYDKGTSFQVISRIWVEDLDSWWITVQEVPAFLPGEATAAAERLRPIGPGETVADVIQRASSIEELYEQGVRPHEIAQVATGPLLQRLFPALPGLSATQAGELAALLQDPQIVGMLHNSSGAISPMHAEALLAKLGGHPALVHALLRAPEVRHALAARPATFDHLASHRNAIDAVCAVAEDIRTRGTK